MIKYLLIGALQVCGTPTIINNSGEPWNAFDQSILLVANKRCGQLFKDSTCVKLIRKNKSKDYGVICGKGK